MTPQREFGDYLRDMLDAITKVAAFIEGMSKEQFRALEVIGEAAKNIPQPVRDRYPQVPWREAAGIRDKLITSISA